MYIWDKAPGRIYDSSISIEVLMGYIYFSITTLSMSSLGGPAA
jgi:hypothetical protein